MPRQKQRSLNVPAVLDDAADTFAERNKIYGNNYLRLANAMVSMFPDGLTLQTQRDWIRLHLFLAMITKQSRYATNWDKGGHAESLEDNAVYSAMLKAYDASDMEAP